MPLFGQLDHEARKASAPFVRTLAKDEQPSLSAQILTFTSEIETNSALACIPSALHPSIPPYAKIELRRLEDSPWGPVSFAELKIMVRATTIQMGYRTGAFCDNDEAARYLSQHYGCPVLRGSIGLEKRYYGYEGRIAAEGRLVFDGLLERPQPIAPVDVLFTPTLNLAHHDSALKLVQEECDITVERADRGTHRIRTFLPDAFGEERVRLGEPLPATWAQGSLVYKPVRFLIDPASPAMAGTTRVEEESAA